MAVSNSVIYALRDSAGSDGCRRLALFRAGFDGICRKNGIRHWLTDPFSPNQNGKVDRFHGTLRPDFLDQAEPFESVVLAQAALDVWVADYNQDRPHQALDPTLPVTPAERFPPIPEQQRQLVELWLPPALETVPTPLASMAATIEPARNGPVDRSSSTRSCRRRATCRWPAGNSGSDPPEPV